MLIMNVNYAEIVDEDGFIKLIFLISTLKKSETKAIQKKVVNCCYGNKN